MVLRVQELEKTHPMLLIASIFCIGRRDLSRPGLLQLYFVSLLAFDSLNDLEDDLNYIRFEFVLQLLLVAAVLEEVCDLIVGV